MRSLTSRESRLVAVGLLLAAVAGVWLLGVAPYLDGFKARAVRRAQLVLRYQAGQRLLDATPAMRAEAVQQRRSATGFRIGAPTREAAALALRQRLGATLTAAGGVVAAVEDIQTDVAPDHVSARADAVIPYTQLVAALLQLENQEPHVVVDYAALGADRAARSGHGAPLDLRLQVSAAFHPAAAR